MERPNDPTLVNILNDYSSRLRALERQRLLLPEGTGPLQTLEDGTQLGDTRFLNFGQNIDAVLEGDDYVTISAAATAPEFDAICDMTLTASQPENRLFKGIGEALMYLRQTVGLTERAIVLVRGHPTQTNPGLGDTYVETADVGLTGATSVPNNIFLFGTNPTPPNGGGGATLGNAPYWDHNGFRISGSNWYIQGLAMSPKRTGGVASGKTSFLESNAVFVDCYFDGVGLAGTSGSRFLATTTWAIMIRCNMWNGWWAFSEAYDSSFRIYTPGTYNPGIGTYFKMLDCRLQATTELGGAVTWNLPAYTNMRLQEDISGSGSVVPVFSCAAASGKYYFEKQNAFQPFFNVTSTTAADSVVMKGSFAGSVTLAAPAISVGAMAGHFLEGSFSTLDITGPAFLNVQTAAAITLRGDGIKGSIFTRRTGSNGTAISFVGCDRSELTVAGSPNLASPPSGTFKPYSFDATSDDNLLVWHVSNVYPAVGTDAGARNRVLPEGSVPFTTNGHVIQDEGVSLTQRLNLDFAGAGVTATDTAGRTLVTIPGGATINGHVIEDEATPLTQRANMNFVGAGVTATDAGGKTVVTIPATATVNGHVIEDEGTPVTQQATMNFTGTGVTVTDAGGKTVVDIPTSSSRTFAFFTL